jgi:hypothetical protein
VFELAALQHGNANTIIEILRTLNPKRERGIATKIKPVRCRM